MDEIGIDNPIFQLAANCELKSNFINKMDQMGPSMNQMDMNQMNSSIMNNPIMNQMDSSIMNNNLTMYQMDSLMMNNPMMNQMNLLKINNILMNQMGSLMENNNQMMMPMNLTGQKLMNYQNSNSNDKGNQEIFNERITLGFVISSINDITNIECLGNEKVSDVIFRYRIKSKNNNPKARFIFNSKELNPHLTVFESGLTHNSKIYIFNSGDVTGGDYSMMFTDISKNKTKEIQFSKTAPSYRQVAKGINIFGICNFKKCVAYKKEVIIKVKKKKLDLIKERDELFCPECEATIIPKTVGFYLCKFLIYGKKLEGGKEKSFENEKDEANKKDSLKYFDPELNGEVMFTKLVFEVLEYL